MPDKNTAADRVLATLSKDPELLAAVAKKLASRSADQAPLTEAIDLLAEGQVAFQRFCDINDIRRAVYSVADPSGHKRNPKVKVWKAFMRDNAIPRNVKIAKLLAAYFEGHLPPEVKEFCLYVDEYQDLITDWDNDVPGVKPTTGRNFPAGFDDYLKGVRDNRMVLKNRTAWAVLMTEHEFGQRVEGWTLHLSQEAALSAKTESAGSTATREQYFTYGPPQPLTVDPDVWEHLLLNGELRSKGNHLPKKGMVVTMEHIR